MDKTELNLSFDYFDMALSRFREALEIDSKENTSTWTLQSNDLNLLSRCPGKP